MKYINELCERRSEISKIKYEIIKAYEVLTDCYKKGNKVLICGNGGSSSDSSHITGELMKSFKKKRTIDETIEDKLKKSIEDLYDKNSMINSLNKLNEMKENIEQGLPTIDLTSFVGLNTAYSNDRNAEYVFANSVIGLGNRNDVLIAISTSGNSNNIINAAIAAHAKEMKVIALSGKDGGLLKDIADISIIVPLFDTYLIQEEHIAIYHSLCLDLEDTFF